MTPFLLAQLLAGLAVLSNFASFQFKGRVTTLGLLTLSVALVSAHLFLLGEEAAGWVTAFAIVYFLVSTQTTKRWVMWSFMLAATGLWLVTYERALDWLVLLSTVATLLSIYNPSPKRMREWQFLGTVTRIIFYVIIFSPVALLLEASLLISNALSYYRFFWKREA